MDTPSNAAAVISFSYIHPFTSHTCGATSGKESRPGVRVRTHLCRLDRAHHRGSPKMRRIGFAGENPRLQLSCGARFLAVFPAETTVRRLLARIEGDALDHAVGRWLADRRPKATGLGGP